MARAVEATWRIIMTFNNFTGPCLDNLSKSEIS
jgi:hypothetical protein